MRKIAKRTFYIYNTPGEYIFVPPRHGLYKITVIGGGGGGYGGSGIAEESFPYQSAGGGGGGTSTGILELEADTAYKLTVGFGGDGGDSLLPSNVLQGVANSGKNGGSSDFANILTAEGGTGGYHHTAEEYSGISGRGGKAYGGEVNISGGDGSVGYYLANEREYSLPRTSGGNSTHGIGGRGHAYKELRRNIRLSRYTVNGSGKNGFDGKGYGSGGGGAGFYSFNRCGFRGGDGSGGLIIIEEAAGFVIETFLPPAAQGTF